MTDLLDFLSIRDSITHLNNLLEKVEEGELKEHLYAAIDELETISCLMNEN